MKLYGLVQLGCIGLVLADDVYYHSEGGFRNPHRRYIDIFTNHPNVDDVLSNFGSFKRSGERYVYPKSNIQTSYTLENRGNHKSRHHHMPEDEDYLKFDADVTLQSDYGNFDNGEAPRSDGRQLNFHRNTRPKFRTGRNHSDDLFDQNYFTNIQKIPRFEDQEHDNYNEGVNENLRQLLKKYLVKLYKKKQQLELAEDNKEEVMDSAEIEDNIETLDDLQGEQSQNYYNVINSGPYDQLYLNKSKFLDPSKLIVLKNSTKFLANKFLSLFTIIQFPNGPCVAMDQLTYYEGTCYYLTECQAMNGTAMGSCANGYGVCCVFTGTCGGSSGQNCTYFQSPNYPNYYPSNGTVLPPPANNNTIDPRLRYQLMMFLARQESTTNSLSCIFQVLKSSSNVRQLRVDFLDLELRGPTNGTCVEERLIISGQNLNDMVPVICGYNTGQPIYVDVADVQGPIQFSILSRTVERKRFRIRICQIASCADSQNCLQYYTGVRGVISSFNYDQTASMNRSMPGYFNNLNYAICIRREAGYCSITYTTAQNGTTYPFQIPNVDEAGQPTVPPGQAGAEIFSCPDDYVVINGIRLCGDRFNDGSVVQDFTQNAPVTDASAGPIVIPVRTDGSVTGRGFKLFYTQNRCPNT